ncbi:SPOR domain-containing protein [Longimicrobium sp.]|uniref:SPOR domain-containing protein n=1 Tax=Longimicrobium sp. TaxID=2029185 RepID=UPI002C16E21A|nr:SPOR domain-containing protein [Longimicrobium sp.]HSU17981.1 SPOR domain-containing protein [Longimicrobium sp.]
MTDPQTATGYSGRRLPPPTFFDPTFERLPGAAAFDADRPGPVLILFDPRADRAWVADAAIALATGWNAGGRRTVLADLSIEDPVLHERVGVPNLDGVVDLFLYGASLARSARPVPGRGFLLITAGTYTPEPDAIFRHARWGKIVDGFREAQASLLLFVPLDAPGLPALGEWAGDVILLGDREDGELFDSLVPAPFRIRAWLTPPAREPFRVAEGSVRPAPYGSAPQPVSPPPQPVVPPAPGDRFPQPEPAGFQPWMGPPRETAPRGPEPLPTAHEAPHASAAALPVPEPVWDDTVGDEPPGKRRKKKSIPKKRRISPLVLVLLVLAFMALAVGAAMVFLPGLLKGLPGRAERPAGEAPGVPPRRAQAGPTVRPAGTPRPYAVVVKAFQGDQAYDAARKLAGQVQSAIPGTEAYVFPEDIGGVVYYRVFAGSLADTAQAVALRNELVRKKLADPESVGGPDALIQPRPLAFDLGEFDSKEAAERRAEALRAGAIDAYPAAVPQTDGTERWALYAGAFADTAQAAPMKKTLESSRLPARLVRRVGRAPATSK